MIAGYIPFSGHHRLKFASALLRFFVCRRCFAKTTLHTGMYLRRAGLAGAYIIANLCGEYSLAVRRGSKKERALE